MRSSNGHISPTASLRKRDLASLVLTQVMVLANGPFVYTGFKPAFVMYKRTRYKHLIGLCLTIKDIFNPMLQAIS
jgi:hypothetical protein